MRQNIACLACSNPAPGRPRQAGGPGCCGVPAGQRLSALAGGGRGLPPSFRSIQPCNAARPRAHHARAGQLRPSGAAPAARTACWHLPAPSPRAARSAPAARPHLGRPPCRAGKNTGEAYVELQSTADAKKALQEKQHQHMGSRYIE